LYYYEGYRIEEIAALTGSKAATVGTRLARARAQIRDMLGDDIDE
jgi:RNA polymerase sigma-70 factor (ECF subfamily)